MNCYWISQFLPHTCEELFYFQRKGLILCGLWRFANALGHNYREGSNEMKEFDKIRPLYSVETLCKNYIISDRNKASFGKIIDSIPKMIRNLLPEEIVNRYTNVGTTNHLSFIRHGKTSAGKLGEIFYGYLDTDADHYLFLKNHLANVIKKHTTEHERHRLRESVIDKIFMGRRPINFDGDIYLTTYGFFRNVEEASSDIPLLKKMEPEIKYVGTSDRDGVENTEIMVSMLGEQTKADPLYLKDVRELFINRKDVYIDIQEKGNTNILYICKNEEGDIRESILDCNLEEAAKLSLYARRYQEIKDDAEALACIFMCAFCIGDIENRIAHIFPEKNEELKNAVHAGKKAGASGKSAMEETWDDQQLLHFIISSFQEKSDFEAAGNWILKLWRQNQGFWKGKSSLCLANYILLQIGEKEKFQEIFASIKGSQPKREQALLEACYKFAVGNPKEVQEKCFFGGLWGEACWQLVNHIFHHQIVDYSYDLSTVIESAQKYGCPRNKLCLLKGSILADDIFYPMIFGDERFYCHRIGSGNIDLDRRVAACFEYLDESLDRAFWKIGIRHLNDAICKYGQERYIQEIQQNFKREIPEWQECDLGNIGERYDKQNRIGQPGKESVKIKEEIVNEKGKSEKIRKILLRQEIQQIRHSSDTFIYNRTRQGQGVSNALSHRAEKAEAQACSWKERFLVFGFGQKTRIFLKSLQGKPVKINLYVASEDRKDAEKQIENESLPCNKVEDSVPAISELLKALPVYSWDGEKEDGYKFGQEKIHFVFLGEDKAYALEAIRGIIDFTAQKEQEINQILRARDRKDGCIFGKNVDIVLDCEGTVEGKYLDMAFGLYSSFYLPIRYLNLYEELSRDILYRLPLYMGCQEKDVQNIVILGNHPAIPVLVKNILSVAMFGKCRQFDGDADAGKIEKALGEKFSLTMIDKDAQQMRRKLQYEFSELFADQPYEKIVPQCIVLDAESYEFFEYFRNPAGQKEYGKILQEANYFICALGDEKRSIDFAFRLRSGILKRDMKFERRPVIAVLSDHAPYVLPLNQFSVGNGKSSPKWYSNWDINTFGEKSRYYTYGNIYENFAEKLALCMHLSYYGKGEQQAALHSYYASSYNRDSSMAAALYIPYRLYSAGVYKSFPFTETSLEYLAEEKKCGRLKDLDDCQVECLAIQEHARWNLYMALQGYAPASKAQVGEWLAKGFMNHQFHLAKLHPYIASWAKLGDFHSPKMDIRAEKMAGQGSHIAKMLEEAHSNLKAYASEKGRILMRWGFLEEPSEEREDWLYLYQYMPEKFHDALAEHLMESKTMVSLLRDLEERLLECYLYYKKIYEDIEEILGDQMQGMPSSGPKYPESEEEQKAFIKIANQRVGFAMESQKREKELSEALSRFRQEAAKEEVGMDAYYGSFAETDSKLWEEFSALEKKKKKAIAGRKKPGLYSLESLKDQIGEKLPVCQQEKYRLRRSLDCLLRLSYGGMFSYKEGLDDFLGEKLASLPEGSRQGKVLGGIRSHILDLMQKCAEAVEYEADGIQEWMHQYQRFHHLKLSRSSVKDIDRETVRNIWKIAESICNPSEE